jgi:hypothetical protein
MRQAVAEQERDEQNSALMESGAEQEDEEGSPRHLPHRNDSSHSFSLLQGAPARAGELLRKTLVKADIQMSAEDIADALSLIQQPDADGFRDADGGSLDEDAVVRWFRDSVFAHTVQSSIHDQLYATGLAKRNKLLSDILHIPKDDWGFEEDEMGMIGLETLGQHSLHATKRAIRTFWHDRGATLDDLAKKGASNRVDAATGQSNFEKIDFDAVDEEADRQLSNSTLLQVIEKLGMNLALQYTALEVPTPHKKGELSEVQLQWMRKKISEKAELKQAAFEVALMKIKVRPAFSFWLGGLLSKTGRRGRLEYSPPHPRHRCAL